MSRKKHVTLKKKKNGDARRRRGGGKGTRRKISGGETDDVENLKKYSKKLLDTVNAVYAVYGKNSFDSSNLSNFYTEIDKKFQDIQNNEVKQNNKVIKDIDNVINNLNQKEKNKKEEEKFLKYCESVFGKLVDSIAKFNTENVAAVNKENVDLKDVFSNLQSVIVKLRNINNIQDNKIQEKYNFYGKKNDKSDTLLDKLNTEYTKYVTNKTNNLKSTEEAEQLIQQVEEYGSELLIWLLDLYKDDKFNETDLKGKITNKKPNLNEQEEKHKQINDYTNTIKDYTKTIEDYTKTIEDYTKTIEEYANQIEYIEKNVNEANEANDYDTFSNMSMNLSRIDLINYLGDQNAITNIDNKLTKLKYQINSGGVVDDSNKELINRINGLQTRITNMQTDKTIENAIDNINNKVFEKITGFEKEIKQNTSQFDNIFGLNAITDTITVRNFRNNKTLEKIKEYGDKFLKKNDLTSFKELRKSINVNLTNISPYYSVKLLSLGYLLQKLQLISKDITKNTNFLTLYNLLNALEKKTEQLEEKTEKNIIVNPANQTEREQPVTDSEEFEKLKKLEEELETNINGSNYEDVLENLKTDDKLKDVLSDNTLENIKKQAEQVVQIVNDNNSDNSDNSDNSGNNKELNDAKQTNSDAIKTILPTDTDGPIDNDTPPDNTRTQLTDKEQLKQKLEEIKTKIVSTFTDGAAKTTAEQSIDTLLKKIQENNDNNVDIENVTRLITNTLKNETNTKTDNEKMNLLNETETLIEKIYPKSVVINSSITQDQNQDPTDQNQDQNQIIHTTSSKNSSKNPPPPQSFLRSLNFDFKDGVVCVSSKPEEEQKQIGGKRTRKIKKSKKSKSLNKRKPKKSKSAKKIKRQRK